MAYGVDNGMDQPGDVLGLMEHSKDSEANLSRIALGGLSTCQSDDYLYLCSSLPLQFVYHKQYLKDLGAPYLHISTYSYTNGVGPSPPTAVVLSVVSGTSSSSIEGSLELILPFFHDLPLDPLVSSFSILLLSPIPGPS